MPTLLNPAGLGRATERDSARAWVVLASFYAVMIGMLLVDKYDFLQEPDRVFGVAFVLAAFSYLRGNPLLWSVEATFLGLFIVWAGASGLIVAVDQAAVGEYLRLLIQTWFLAAATGIIDAKRGHSRYSLAVFLVYTVVVGMYLLGSGEPDLVRFAPGYRAQSVTANPNFLGFLGVYGAMAAALLWRREPSSGRRNLLFGCLTIANLGLIFMSASRKSVAGLVVFGLLWLYRCSPFLCRRRAHGIVVALLVVGGVVGAGLRLLEDSTLGKRIEQTRADPVADESRLEMYEIGVDVIMDNPIAGVGLGNYKIVSGLNTYSHSEYIEVLSTTGLVGGILYFGVYVIIWRRLRRLDNAERSPNQRYVWRLYEVVLVTTLVLGLGGPNFLSPWHMVIVFAIVGHTRFAAGETRLPVRRNAGWRRPGREVPASAGRPA